MWIRSQDGLRLHNVNRIEIEHFENKEIVTVTGDGWFLGEYSNEKKALKVLDEIQTCIMTEHRFCTEDVNCIGKYFTKEWKEIYQMPADEDVEV